MACRVAAQDLIKFCDDNPNCGIWYTIAETTSQFTFANSESTKCKQKLIICMYDREYAVQSTEFDIVEQGHVPILMSLPQMRNLRFQFELHPDKALLSSPILGIWDVNLKVAPISHLVLDLLDLSRLMWNVRFDKYKKSSFLTYFSHYEYGYHQKTLGSSSLEEEPKVFAFAMDDEWVIDEASMELIRLHKKTRRTRYEPKEGAVPIPLEYLDDKRKTIIEFSKGKNVTHEDSWRSSEPPTSKVTEPWKGRTVFQILLPAKTRDPTRRKVGSPDEEFSKGKPGDSSERIGASGSSPPGEVPVRRRVRTKGRGPLGPAPKVAGALLAPEDDPDLQEYEPSLPEGPEISSLEPRRIALPLPGQEVSKASPQYQRILEKLNNDVELYKLPLKHYHMSPAQFRRRTSMLGLPGEIYDKYDRIVKVCRVCSISVPTSPRPRIAGLRASSFGDLIFVDHEEIKFGTNLSHHRWCLESPVGYGSH